LLPRTYYLMTSVGIGIFPYKLHQILADSEEAGTEHIVSWLACGKLFKVHDQQEFSRVIMRKYFRHARFKSFLRQLSMYKFQRITDGPNRGAYGHPQFVRGRIELSRTINRGEKLPMMEEEKKDLTVLSSSDNQRKLPSSSQLPVVKVLSTGSDYCFDSIEVTTCKVTKQLSSFPSMDHKFFNYTVLLNSELTTPADILDEIISTFGHCPIQTQESSCEGDVDVIDELSSWLNLDPSAAMS
jgi:hypothetical protein